MNILKKTRAKQADLFAPPVAIAFLGDSVTQGCFEVYLTSEGAVQTVFEPESGYAADVRKLFALLYPGVPVQFINAGISGDNAPSGLQRLERDVLAYHPDLTVVCFGLNDACRGDETQEEYASALDGIFTKLKEAGSEIIFMTPNMMNTRLSEKLTVPEIRAVAEDTLKIQLDGRLERYLDAAREVCTRQGAAVCRLLCQMEAAQPKRRGYHGAARQRHQPSQPGDGMDVCLFAAGDDDALKNQKNAGRMNFMRPASVCQKTPQKRLEIWYNREKSEVRKWKNEGKMHGVSR